MSALDAKAFTEAAAKVLSWKRPLLISHANPDGDALGSLVAMRTLLCSSGIDATILLFRAVPDRYALFHQYQAMSVLGRDIREAELAGFDGIILLDTCTYIQVDPIADWFHAATVEKIAIDHHITREDVADLYLIDESAAATCLIIYDWAKAVDWPIDAETCEAMFVGMAMDTGWFRYSNTDGRVLAAAADLVARGADAHNLYERLYLCETPARVRLLGAALSTLELLLDDHLAVMTLSAEAIAGAGATRNDTEDIVNEPMRIGSVVVSVLLVEAGDGNIRVNFRSKPPVQDAADAGGRPIPPSQRRRTDIDVAKIAQSFDGGGHTRAAGARIAGSLTDVHRRIVDHVRDVLSA